VAGLSIGKPREALLGGAQRGRGGPAQPPAAAWAEKSEV